MALKGSVAMRVIFREAERNEAIPSFNYAYIEVVMQYTLV